MEEQKEAIIAFFHETESQAVGHVGICGKLLIFRVFVRKSW